MDNKRYKSTKYRTKHSNLTKNIKHFEVTRLQCSNKPMHI